MKTLWQLLLLIIVSPAFARTTDQTNHPKSSGYSNFACQLSADFGGMDGPLKKKFTPVSASEKYFQVAEHFDLKVTAKYDEAGESYTVEASGADDFHVKATIPYYPDANLRFAYGFHDASGNLVAFTEFVVQCTK